MNMPPLLEYNKGGIFISCTYKFKLSIQLTIYPREPYNYLLYEDCVEKDGTSQTDLVETKLMG